MKSLPRNFQSGNGQSTISNANAIHSSASTAASGVADAGTVLSFTTISGSIFGARMRASDTVPRPPVAYCTVSSYMFAHTSVFSSRVRQTARLASPILRPTVVRPPARRRRAISASTA